MLEALPLKSDTSLAILYALNRWEALTRYCDNEQLAIGNVLIECARRSVALMHHCAHQEPIC
ncbi:IS66 family transposase [Burkholderia cenocepacia]|nr:IS66 family transposase [Burkholderia cenocepacia]MDR8093328.1 IS66 family transposase [Burkholderia cenocepacia]